MPTDVSPPNYNRQNEERMAEPRRFYTCIPREEKGLSDALRTYCETHFGREIFHERRRDGERSGDLYEEVASLAEYRTRDGNSRIQLYVAEDDNTNGYAMMISVLLPDGGGDDIEAFASFLQEHDLVSSHKRLQKGPSRNPTFRPYLNGWYKWVDAPEEAF